MEGKWIARVTDLQAQLDGALRRIEDQRVRLVELEKEREQWEANTRAIAKTHQAQLAEALKDIDEAREAEALVERDREMAIAENGRLHATLVEVKERYYATEAALADTPENVAAVIASIEPPERGLRDVVWDGARILAALRARAGMP